MACEKPGYGVVRWMGASGRRRAPASVSASDANAGVGAAAMAVTGHATACARRGRVGWRAGHGTTLDGKEDGERDRGKGAVVVMIGSGEAGAR